MLKDQTRRGVVRATSGYSTTALGTTGRTYVEHCLATGKPFVLYETPQAPHWSDVTQPDGTVVQLAMPDTKYAQANVGSCAGPGEADRSDKPQYVRWMSFTTAQAQAMCESQMRAIMTTDDEFHATMRLLEARGVLANTLVILTSDNGYMWGEHGRTEKFVPYEPSIRVPLYLRWPGHVAAGVEPARVVSYLDILPTLLDAAGYAIPAAAPALDGQSLLQPGTRTTMFSEYYLDSANGKVPTWGMIRGNGVKYVEYVDTTGVVTFREYYDLTLDVNENLNLLGDKNLTNDPPAATVAALAQQLHEMAACAGAACVRQRQREGSNLRRLSWVVSEGI